MNHSNQIDLGRRLAMTAMIINETPTAKGHVALPMHSPLKQSVGPGINKRFVWENLSGLQQVV